MRRTRPPRLAARQCGHTPEVIGLLDHPTGVFARAGDTTRQRGLGFAPRIDLQTGIERVIALLE